MPPIDLRQELGRKLPVLGQRARALHWSIWYPIATQIDQSATGLRLARQGDVHLGV